MTAGLSTAGTYYIRVLSSSSYGAPSGSYGVTLTVSGATGGVEIEPNDETAQVVTSGESIVGSLSSADDLDWYAIEVGASGALGVSFETEENNYSYSFDLFIVNSEGDTLASDSCSSQCDTTANLVTAGLSSSGIYYVLVRSSSSSGAPSGSYTFSATYSDNTTNYELEPNNSKDTAQSLISGTGVVGGISLASDQDWYSISVDSASSLSVSFETEDNNYSYSFDFEILDNLGNVLASDSCSSQCDTAANPVSYTHLRAHET